MSVLWIEGADGTAETAMKHVERALAGEQATAFLPPAAADASSEVPAGDPAPPGRVLRGGPLRPLAAFYRMLEDQLRTTRQVLRRVRALESADTAVRLEQAEQQLERLAKAHRELHRRVAELERTAKSP